MGAEEIAAEKAAEVKSPARKTHAKTEKKCEAEDADGNTAHLYPAFAALIAEALKTANHDSRHPDGTAKWAGFQRWGLFEGYRSQARQTWLFASGRTRQGAVVTQKRTPDHHGYGLAADIVWFDTGNTPQWDGADTLWQTLGHAARSIGLIWGGDWSGFPDTVHLQAAPAQMTLWTPLAAIYLHERGLTCPSRTA